MKEEKILYSAIYDIYKESRSLYGSPRIHERLCKMGMDCSRKRVARIMRKNGACIGHFGQRIVLFRTVECKINHIIVTMYKLSQTEYQALSA